LISITTLTLSWASPSFQPISLWHFPSDEKIPSDIQNNCSRRQYGSASSGWHGVGPEYA
jgi:hypothetical protein